MSDTDDWREDFAAFMERVYERMEQGEREYGNKSFDLHPAQLAGEIEEEVADIAAWAMVLWRRVRALKERAG